VKDKITPNSGIGAASLTPASILTLTDGVTNSSFGTSVGTAGDVNGDGYPDVIVGAPGDISGTERVYVYAGSAAGLSITPAYTLVSQGASNRFGVSIGTAGDVNGDGFSDVIVGALGYLSATGQAYVYLGSPNGLSATPAFTATGEAALNSLGASVGTAGDVNGDSYADIIVGAWLYGGGLGRAYVYLGSAVGLSSTPALTVTGQGTDNALGTSVGTAGDVNGDGYDDVIIGAPAAISNTGQVFVYLGTSGGLSATPALTLTGEPKYSHFGWSVGTAGDVNGDNYSDVVVSAPGGAGGEGRIYVYLGSATGLSPTPIFTDFDAQANNNFGYSVSTAGDVNGDGHDDIIVGTYTYTSNAGRAYVYLGSGDGRGLIAVPAFVVANGGTSGYFGSSVSTAGDVNKDGYADVIVGAPGQAYVYYGAAYTPPWSVVGDTPDRELGYSVATAGDVNKDSYADVIVGAPGDYLTSTGQAYVYLGSMTGLGLTPAFTATGEGIGDQLGWSVNTAGDVNHDGYSDIVIGAPGSYYTSTGRAYIYLGSATGVTVTPAYTFTGQASGEHLGQSVATAGDINGDSYSDVIIGARGYLNNMGRAYVYLGSVSGLSATPAFTATGETTNSWFGFSVGTGGDVNQDGYSDVIIGAPGCCTITSSGRVYVYIGSNTGLSTTPVFTAVGQAGDFLGYSVGTAGDMNGDGYADVVVGTYIYSSTKAGLAYVYLGSVNGLNATPAFTATGAFPFDVFGFSVGTAGDINQDGYADIIIGSIYAGNGVGQAFVYPGRANGVGATPIFTATGEAYADAVFGFSVGTAGDVNNDGYADIIVGVPFYQCCANVRGRAVMYLSQSDLSLHKTVTPTVAVPGQAITYTLTFDNAGVAPATDVVINDLVPGQMSNLSYTSNGAAITSTAGITYSWQVADLAPGEGGVITLTGVLNPGLTVGATFTNTAVIAGSGVDNLLYDNIGQAVVTIGNIHSEIYLPLIQK
jgi:uncharacterized repeat protein (TIGR01451 family)